MIIDGHNHPDWNGHDLDRFLANMKQYHIAKTWILPRECPDDEVPHDAIAYYTPGVPGLGQLPFSRCLSYVERAPTKFILGYAPDPRRPGAIDRLAAAIAIYGVKVFGELKLRMCYDNPDAVRLFRFCGEKNLPVIAHLQYGIGQKTPGYPRPDYWYGGGIDAFARAIKQCPETVFIGHGPGFWAHFSDDDLYKSEMYPQGPVVPDGQVITLLRRHQNLYCDLSAGSGLNALSRDAACGRAFLEEFQDRALYARDCFDNRLQEFLNGLGLSKKILEKIYCRNAEKLIN